MTTPEELKTLCDTVVELTKIKQSHCRDLNVECFAPDLLKKLLIELDWFKKHYPKRD